MPNGRPRVLYCLPSIDETVRSPLVEARKNLSYGKDRRDNLQYMQEESSFDLQIASTQFADQIAAAMLAAKATNQEQFQHLSAATERLVEIRRL